jgi:hypothetical protein
MLAFANNPIYGIAEKFACDNPNLSGPRSTASHQPADSNILGQLVALYRNNTYLLSELENVHSRLTHAREYLGAPGSNPVLARAHLDRLRAKRSAALHLLRANRVQVRALLSGRAPALALHQADS